MVDNNPFLSRTDIEILDQLYTIQVGKVVSVDEANALVQVEWADKKGARVGIPFPMPFSGNGWGIWAMPSIGESVLIGFRPSQFPVILAWSPHNISSPYSYYGQMLTDYNVKKNISSGEILLRNRIGYANCKVCNEISTLAEWNANAVPQGDRKMDKCPVCGALAVDRSNPDAPPIMNKLYLGCYVYIQKDGTFEIGQDFDLSDGSVIDGANFKLTSQGSVILRDKLGNRVETDTALGSIKIQQSIITDPTHGTQIVHDASSIELKDDGQVVIQQRLKKNSNAVEDGASITMDATGGITIQPKDGKVIISIDINGNVNITADTKIVMTCPEVDIGDSSAKALAVAQKVSDKVNSFINTFNGHMHPPGMYITSMGPVTGVSGSPSTSAPSILVGDIATTKAKGS